MFLKAFFFRVFKTHNYLIKCLTWLIDFILFKAVFTLFSYVAATRAPIYVFLVIILAVLRTVSFPIQWLLSHVTIIQTMVSGEREMNSVWLTFIFREKMVGPGIKPAIPVLKTPFLHYGSFPFTSVVGLESRPPSRSIFIFVT